MISFCLNLSPQKVMFAVLYFIRKKYQEFNYYSKMAKLSFNFFQRSPAKLHLEVQV